MGIMHPAQTWAVDRRQVPQQCRQIALDFCLRGCWGKRGERDGLYLRKLVGSGAARIHLPVNQGELQFVLLAEDVGATCVAVRQLQQHNCLYQTRLTLVSS